MARTKIDVQGVINANGQINSAKRTVNLIRDDLDWTREQISGSILNRNNLRQRLRNVSNSLRNVENRMNRIKVMVENGANSYKNTDKGVVTRRANIGKASKKVIAGGGAGSFVAVEPVKQAVNKVEIKEKDIVIPKHVLNNAKIISGVDYTYDFLNARNQVFDALACAWDSDWIKNTLSIFGPVENMNEEAVRKSIESLIKDTLKNKHESTDYMDELTSGLTPEEFETFKKALDFIVDQGKTVSKHNLAEHLGISEKQIEDTQYLNFICERDYLSCYYLADGLKKTIGKYADGVEAIDVASQMIGRVMNDYTEDLEYLESIEQALISSGYNKDVVNDTIQTIKYNYNNQAISALTIGFNKLCEEGTGELIDTYLPTLNLFLAAKDLGCAVSGLGDKTDNLEMIYTTQHYSGSLIQEYENYANIIRTGEYTQDDVDKCNTYFELARNAKIQEYEAMVNLYEGALEDTDVNMFSGVLDVIHAISVSEEEKQTVKTQIDIIEDEITRLEKLDGYSPSLKDLDIRARAVVGGSSSMGGR